GPPSSGSLRSRIGASSFCPRFKDGAQDRRSAFLIYLGFYTQREGPTFKVSAVNPPARAAVVREPAEGLASTGALDSSTRAIQGDFALEQAPQKVRRRCVASIAQRRPDPGQRLRS